MYYSFGGCPRNCSISFPSSIIAHDWGTPKHCIVPYLWYTSAVVLMSSRISCGVFINIQQLNVWLLRLVQDGGVEGCALTPSCESTGITTNCWTIIDRKTLELTKKDIPHPKTTEKPQWDGRRGTITIKSNPITARWVTHKLENHRSPPTGVKVLSPTSGFPTRGSSNGRRNS